MYLIITYAVGKNQGQGYVSPDDFNNILMPTSQQQYLDYLLGEYQQYKSQRPIAVVQVGNGERIRNSVAPLIYNTILAPNTSTGIANYPSDYEAVDAMWGVYGIYNIRFVNQPRLASFWQSQIDPIASNQVYILEEDGIHFYPENIGLAKMSYVRTPPSIFWGYTRDANGLPVWNPATSQDPVWSDTDCFQIIIRALRLVGVNLDYSSVVQLSEEVKTIGQ